MEGLGDPTETAGIKTVSYIVSTIFRVGANSAPFCAMTKAHKRANTVKKTVSFAKKGPNNCTGI
jgi:hypothetical protein